MKSITKKYKILFILKLTKLTRKRKHVIYIKMFLEYVFENLMIEVIHVINQYTKQ
jgi:hypothetical protein